MNTKTTIQSLKQVLIPFIHKTSMSNNLVIMDNATPHTSNETIKFMNENNINFFKFGGRVNGFEGGYPANSPDLNPIELVFNIIDNVVSKQQPTTLKALMDLIIKQWNEIDQKKIVSCIMSVKKRWKWVLQHNGNIYQVL